MGKWRVQSLRLREKLYKPISRHNNADIYHLKHHLLPSDRQSTMSLGVLDAVGLVSGGLGIISFFQNLLPDAQAPQGTSVNIKAGITQIGDDITNLVSKHFALLVYR